MLKIFAIIFRVMKETILTFMVLLEKGTVSVKVTISLCFSLLIAPIAWLIEHFQTTFFPDINYVFILSVAIAVDLFTGMWKHRKLHDFDFKDLYQGLLTKIAVSFCGAILFGGVTSISDFQNHPDIKSYLLLIGKIANFLYVAGSAWNNLFIITNGKFPPVGWMRRMKSFNENISLNDLRDLVGDKDATETTETTTEKEETAS